MIDLRTIVALSKMEITNSMRRPTFSTQNMAMVKIRCILNIIVTTKYVYSVGSYITVLYHAV